MIQAVAPMVLYTQIEASEYLREHHGLRIAARSLQKFRSVGDGPMFRKALGRALYSPADLDAWAQTKLGARVSSTSELPLRHAR